MAGSQCGKGTPCRLRAGPSPPRPPSDQSSQAADSSSSAARRPGCLQGRGAGVHEKLAVRTPPWGAGVSEAARWWPREPRPVPGADRPPSAWCAPHCGWGRGIRKGCRLADSRPPQGEHLAPSTHPSEKDKAWLCGEKDTQVGEAPGHDLAETQACSQLHLRAPALGRREAWGPKATLCPPPLGAPLPGPGAPPPRWARLSPLQAPLCEAWPGAPAHTAPEFLPHVGRTLPAPPSLCHVGRRR